jgi:anti-repressor protein
MNNVTFFRYQQKQVRTVIIDGEAWFVVRDVCEVLTISNDRDALTKVDKEDVGKADTLTNGGLQKMNIVNESGLYALIFMSEKESAKSFKRWVTHEVLPSIRKTGAYSITDILDKNASYPEIRAKSKKIRNELTDTLKSHGYTKQHEYIQTTVQMKKVLGIENKKDSMTKNELRKIMASELVSAINIDESEAFGYREVNPIAIESTKGIHELTSDKNLTARTGEQYESDLVSTY